SGRAGERSETERGEKGAPQKLAKRKRVRVPASTASLHLAADAPLGPEGQGGCFDSPSLGPLDSLPTRSDQGGALDPKEEGRSGRLAEKALYCALEENAHRFFRAVLIRRVLRTKQPNENWRSALIFASIILDAPQKSAKRKRMQ